MAETPQGKDQTRFIGVTIPENLRRAVKAQAALEGKTLSELVTIALKNYLATARKSPA